VSDREREREIEREEEGEEEEERERERGGGGGGQVREREIERERGIKRKKEREKRGAATSRVKRARRVGLCKGVPRRTPLRVKKRSRLLPSSLCACVLSICTCQILGGLSRCAGDGCLVSLSLQVSSRCCCLRRCCCRLPCPGSTREKAQA
jgi:hypothetical protein